MPLIGRSPPLHRWKLERREARGDSLVVEDEVADFNPRMRVSIGRVDPNSHDAIDAAPVEKHLRSEGCLQAGAVEGRPALRTPDGAGYLPGINVAFIEVTLSGGRPAHRLGGAASDGFVAGPKQAPNLHEVVQSEHGVARSGSFRRQHQAVTRPSAMSCATYSSISERAVTASTS